MWFAALLAGLWRWRVLARFCRWVGARMSQRNRELWPRFSSLQAEALAPGPWQPAADICQTPSGWLIKFDLAGVRPGDFQVTFTGQALVVEGFRRDWLVETGAQYYAMEISYNHFQRVLQLPIALEDAHVTTDYRDGMLLVRLQPERSP